MRNDFITKARFALIRLGKVVPFVICAVILVSYCESLVSLITNDYIEFADGVYLNKPISWFIGGYFKYDIVTVFIITIISFAIETCYWNKLACLYLAINLYEKFYFANNEFETYVYYIVSSINILVCVFLCYKGIRQITKSK